jgi:alpha-glucosidase
MLAGAGDHTFCWLDPRLKNTWAYQLAHAVVIYSPLQFIYWYDRPAAFTAESAGMEWFRNLPTVWDETRVIDGHPGEFVAIARRSGERWFVGAITNNGGRVVRLPLEMLAPGRRYVAELYLDGDGPRDIRKLRRSITGGEAIDLTLQPRGGAALMLTPEPGR